ncbi:MAG: hypothetical protein EA406_14470 [Rhodospirillales bacterium]|nr:MAG: hypothetical protein EA406_14470 [Rhodospirillales bacterium]
MTANRLLALGWGLAFAGGLALLSAACDPPGTGADGNAVPAATALHPACCTPWFESGAAEVSLPECRAADGRLEGLETGFTVFTPESGEDGLPPGYTAARALGRLADGREAHWVVHSGGGTGQFSSVLAVTVDGDTLRIIAALPIGDRANGGIVNAAVDAGVLTVERSLTPFDLAALLYQAWGGSDDRPFGLRAYDDLPACAVCRMADAAYRVSADFDQQLQGVRVDAEGLAALDGFRTAPPFDCLFGFATAELGLDWISADRLAEMAAAYRSRCIAGG